MSAETKVDVLFAMDACDEWLGDEDTAQELKKARAAVAELLESFMAYFGPMDDPSISWCDPKPSHRDIFKCEKCGAEHLDCGLIPHIKGCRAVRLRDAMQSIGGAV